MKNCRERRPRRSVEFDITSGDKNQCWIYVQHGRAMRAPT